MERVSIHLDGIPELVKELKLLDDKFKRGSLKRVLRAASKPLIARMKLEAPVSKRDQTGKYGSKSKTKPHTKGNLRNSIGLKFNRNKNNPIAYVGPNRVKAFDAYYAHMVIGGTSSHPTTYKGRTVKFTSKTGKTVIVTKAIHPGTRANPFVARALRGSYSIVMETLKERSLVEIQRIWKMRKAS